MPLYTHAIQSLDPLGLAYLHFIEPRSSGAGRAEVNHQNVPSAMVLFRPLWKRRSDHRPAVLPARRPTRRSPTAMPTRSRSAASSSPIRTCRAACSAAIPLTPYNRATFYGGEEAGYTDYPVHDELEQA